VCQQCPRCSLLRLVSGHATCDVLFLWPTGPHAVFSASQGYAIRQTGRIQSTIPRGYKGVHHRQGMFLQQCLPACSRSLRTKASRGRNSLRSGEMHKLCASMLTVRPTFLLFRLPSCCCSLVCVKIPISRARFRASYRMYGYKISHKHQYH
jgi:hypothetical protein